MNMKIKKSILIPGILMALLCYSGCESMDDNYKQYLGEYNYSGKIDSLRVYPGFERVVLAWDNPKDQKSKTIRIVYGVDSTVLNYDTLVDSVSIEGLDAGTGYEFTVYTLDEHNNMSIPTSITAFPVSQIIVDGLTPPSVVVQTIGADQFISVVGLSNVTMSFSGKIEYTVTSENGFSESGEVELPEMVGKNQIDVPIVTFGIPFLPPDDYTINIKASVWPIIGNLVSIDETWLERTTTVNVQPVVINLMTINGTVSDRYNTEGNEGVLKVIDGDHNSKYLSGNPSTWILWHMDRQYQANNYVMTSANDAESRDPKDWVVEGSNDGTTWTLLDQQTGYVFTSRYQKVKFEIANPAEYSYYRINITANAGSNLFQLADWILYYDSAQ
jgi:F5/8 type C domain.